MNCPATEINSPTAGSRSAIGEGHIAFTELQTAGTERGSRAAEMVSVTGEVNSAVAGWGSGTAAGASAPAETRLDGKFYQIFNKKRLEISPAGASDSGVMVPSARPDQSKPGDCRTETNETSNKENKMRIPIPENKDQFITLAKAISTKHTELGAASPLSGIEGIANLAALVNTADTNNQQSKLLAKQATTATEACDKAIGPDAKTAGGLRFLVTASRGVLAGQNLGQEHKLTDWGFGVIAAPEVTPEARAAAKAARAAAKAAKQSRPSA